MTTTVATAARDYLTIVRLPSCLAGGVSVLLGVHLSVDADRPPAGAVAWAATGIIAAVAFANVVNDVIDVRRDAVDKPHRPLPSGRMSLAAARALTTGLAVAALGCAVPLGARPAAWMAVLLALAAAYSWRLKDTVLAGNVTVAACASSPIVFGAMVAGSASAATWIATGMAFLFMVSYETLKTLVDHDGDAANGVRTFAAVAGPRAARRLLRTLIAALTAVALAATAVSSTPVLYLLAVTATFVVPSWAAIFLLGERTGREALATPVLLMRIAWFLGIIALWLLR